MRRLALKSTHYQPWILLQPNRHTHVKTISAYMLSNYGKTPEKKTTDAGSGSEENYDWLEANRIQAFVKTCVHCSLRNACYKAKNDWRKIEVKHNLRRLKHIARDRLTSKDGLIHRSRRPIEVEGGFGLVKSNKLYNRFRHFSIGKI